jgi:hypothetical protein
MVCLHGVHAASTESLESQHHLTIGVEVVEPPFAHWLLLCVDMEPMVPDPDCRMSDPPPSTYIVVTMADATL